MEKSETVQGSFFRFLTFRLGPEIYGVETDEVLELVTEYHLFPVPPTARLVKGILPWRGRIVPVLDGWERLQLKEANTPGGGCILVLRVKGAEGEFTGAFLADSFLEMVKETEKGRPSPDGPARPFTREALKGPHGIFHLLDTAKFFQVSQGPALAALK